MLKYNIKPSIANKMIFIPFFIFPYYLFCGMYDNLPMDDIITRYFDNLLILFNVRLIGDNIRVWKFGNVSL